MLSPDNGRSIVEDDKGAGFECESQILQNHL